MEDIEKKPLHILSLGAGVQSSAMLLMALRGEIEPMPDAAIFADTQAEPDNVYRQVVLLEKVIGGQFPLYNVTKGNLGADVLAGIETGKRVASVPFFVLNREGLPGIPPESGGMLWRQCTQEYKLVPIRQKIREMWQEAGKPHVVQSIGISLDEMTRMKQSGVKYITNRYPLVDMRMRRSDCVAWLERHGYPEPPKSACKFCPYTSNIRWSRMKREDPETFAQACEFDAKLRTGKLPGVTGDAYVHRSFIPLSEVVFGDEEQLDFQFGFENECEGMCGV